MKKYIVLKDFATLYKGDIINVYTFGHNEFSFYVENRLVEYKECVLFKDRVKDSPKYIWKQKLQQPFNVMTFIAPSCPVNKDVEFSNLYSQNDWVRLCINKTINDFESIGVIETIII